MMDQEILKDSFVQVFKPGGTAVHNELVLLGTTHGFPKTKCCLKHGNEKLIGESLRKLIISIITRMSKLNYKDLSK